jgi:pSer/pThr/pTyr-binding forkhead associated (FHA) protein
MDDAKREAPGAGPERASADYELVGTLTRLSDGRQFVLGFGSLRVGRQRRADLVVAEKTVSRHHADICYEGGRYVLYDHSTNGTWVNGNLVVVAQPLRDRDTVRFGKAEFVFSLKRVPKHAAARTDLAVSGPVPSWPTRIMRGGKRRGERRFRPARVLLLLLVLAVGAAAAVYVFFPELVSGLIP